MNNISAVKTSILSNLINFKQQKAIEPSGKNGEQRHYDLLITYRLQIGGIGRA